MYKEFDAYIPPRIVGHYRFGKRKVFCTKFSMYVKPNFIHRFFMRVFLGIYWEDELN